MRSLPAPRVAGQGTRALPWPHRWCGSSRLGAWAFLMPCEQRFNTMLLLRNCFLVNVLIKKKKKAFYFELIINTQEVAETVQSRPGCPPLPRLLPMPASPTGAEIHAGEYSAFQNGLNSKHASTFLRLFDERINISTEMGPNRCLTDPCYQKASLPLVRELRGLGLNRSK